MASVLSRIQIIMEANAANYNNELRRARQHSQSTFGKISKAAGKMALGVGAALAGMGAASVKTAMSFETAMAEVNKTADFVAEDGLGNLRKELEELSKTMPLAFEELADIAASGGQMGIAGENLAQFTETIAKMGIAFDISAGQAAESMGFIASAYQVPIEKLGEVGDAINEVSNSSGATADKTIDFMLRTGAAANNMNIAAEATAAMGAAIIDAGGSVEKSGTAVSNMLLEMANPEWLKDNANMFKEMGVSTTDFANLVKTDGLAAFNLFREGVIAADDPMSNLRDAFGASAPHVAKLFDETSKFKPLLDAVGQGAAGAATHIGSLDNEYRVMADTTANAFVLMKNSARLVAANLGDALLPAVKQITDALIPMIQNVADWAKENPELIVTIAKVTAVVLGAVVALSSIAGVISNVRIVMIALSGPIGLTVIALGILVAAGALVYQNWDLIKQKATEIWGSITSYIGGKIDAIKSYFSTNFPAMTAIVSAQIGIIKSVFVGGFNLIKNTVQTIMAVIKAVISGDFKAIPGIIGNGLKAAASIVTNMMGNILNIIKNTGTKLYQVGKDLVQGLINGIKSSISGVTNAISDMASSAVSKAKAVLNIRSPSRVMKKVGEQTAEGMAVGIKKGKKAVVTAAQKMAADAVKAVQDGVASLKRELALFGTDSALAALDYDISVGKYRGANTDELRNLTQRLELTKDLATANDSVQSSIDAMIKKRALFNNSSEVASLEYDILYTNRFKNASGERVQQLLDETRSVEALGKQLEATNAIKRRFEQFESDQKSAADAFGGLEINQPQTEAEKLRVAYENKMAIVNRFEDMHTDKAQQAHAARVKLTEDYNQSIKDLEMQKQAQTVGSIAAMFGMVLGESNKGYKAMFAVQKAYDFVQAQSASFTAIAKAWSSAPFPANIPAVATTTLQTGIIPAAIQALAPPSFRGQAHDGIANVPREGTWMLDEGERVVKPADNRKLSDFLDGKNKSVGGDNINVNVTVNSGGSSNVESNKQMGRDMGYAIIATIQQQIIKEKRQGGLLYG